jgi:hypothetical protein
MNSAKHFELGKGINIVDDNDRILIGVGQFEPEMDYPLVKNSKISANSRYTKKNKLTYVDLRASVFMYNPSNKTVHFFKNNAEFEEDNQELKIYKVTKTIEKLLAFRLHELDKSEAYAYVISLDTPNKNTNQTNEKYFHNDELACAFLNDMVRKDLKLHHVTHDANSKVKSSQYTCIEYKTDCVSTTVKTEQQDIIRFWACPGTAVCIENVSQQHSTPYEIPDERRISGNKLIKSPPKIVEDNANGPIRKLNRTQIESINETQYNNIINSISPNTYDVIQNITIPTTAFAFETIKMVDYLATERPMEAGKRVRKIKYRKTKRIVKNRRNMRTARNTKSKYKLSA